MAREIDVGGIDAGVAPHAATANRAKSGMVIRRVHENMPWIRASAPDG